MLPTRKYFSELLKKYDFIQSLWITDCEGALVFNVTTEENGENQNKDKIKTSLSFLFNSAYDQLLKTEGETTKNIISVFDSKTLVQARISKNTFIHIISDSYTFNIEITKEIIVEIARNIDVSSLEKVFLSNENSG